MENRNIYYVYHKCLISQRAPRKLRRKNGQRVQTDNSQKKTNDPLKHMKKMFNLT